ncbi:hypothetical protein LCGC14_2724710 [marine sediment metagenome]|uniref:Uncharacterized protein n=1 Tax=marine sediment metagenome TaxID=412755 RepID=A0A0F8Z956_9ZZZZ
MSLSKKRDAERKRAEREQKLHSRLDVQLKLTPEIADYLESKAGNKTVREYLLKQLSRVAKVGIQPNE